MGSALRALVSLSVAWVQQFLLPAVAVGMKSKALQATMLDEGRVSLRGHHHHHPLTVVNERIQCHGGKMDLHPNT